MHYLFHAVPQYSCRPALPWAAAVPRRTRFQTVDRRRLQGVNEGKFHIHGTLVDKHALQVWLPAIAGHVPAPMVRAISAFLEFSYLVRRSHIDSKTLQQIDAAITQYLQERQVFLDVGVRTTFKLPRHHSIVHYKTLIQQFGAPNGLCLSITENRHITTVKEPWHRSNRNEALGQILLTNQRLDKLSVSRADFLSRGMINGPMSLSGRDVSGDIAPQSSLGTSADTEDAEAVEGMTSLGDVQLARYGGKHDKLHSLKSGH